MTHLAGQHLKKNRQYVLLFNILFNCDDGEIWERTQLVSDDFTMTPVGGAIVYRCISFSPHSPFYEKKKERKKENSFSWLHMVTSYHTRETNHPGQQSLSNRPASRLATAGFLFVYVYLIICVP